jgi:hypothetical protein
MIADRLSPNASGHNQSSRGRGFTLASGAAVSDRRGNRRRSVGGFRPVPVRLEVCNETQER